MKIRYPKTLVITAVLAPVSFAVFLLVLWFTLNAPQGVDPAPPAVDSTTLTLVAMVSFFTSVGSAIAFVSTFILSWTKEKRERALFAIDTERKHLENEKLALELEQLRKNRPEQ